MLNWDRLKRVGAGTACNAWKQVGFYLALSTARQMPLVTSACPSLECGAENEMRPVSEMYLLT